MGFKINRVYTRSGDDGLTALATGTRVSKASLRVCSYGEIDELSSCLGCVSALNDKLSQKLNPHIFLIQQELFDIGAELASESGKLHEQQWQVENKHVRRVENLCDEFGEALPELTSFILPGGPELASRLHLARTVCRRAERSVAALAAKETINPYIIQYLNRLSDLLFIWAFWATSESGVEPKLWEQGSKREL